MASNPFTQFYGQLLHQGNMMADYTRTGTYQKAMYNNSKDFENKIVLDVGTGSGILAFFALQAGAKKVYAVDASDAVNIAKTLAKANGYTDEQFIVIKGKIEEIEIEEKVDIIVSEPIGFLLVHERMLESYAVARDRFLKPNGMMMPTTGSIVLTPFQDHAIYKEQLDKISFWETTDFYGVDLSAMTELAYDEFFSQPIVGYIQPSSLISMHRTIHTIDFLEVTKEDLMNFEIHYTFKIEKTALMHGFAGWFDIAFLGTSENIILSTSPESPGTHWYQCRLLFKEPLAVNKGQYISGKMHFQANESFSYDIDMVAKIDGTNISAKNIIHLKDQQYHYLNQPSSS